MTRLLCFTLGIAIASSCVLQGCQSQSRGSTVEATDLEGAYEFVSDTITLSKPKAVTERRIPPDWIGMWIFKDGRFSQTLMKQERSWNPFPTNQDELGYQSSTGSYRIDGRHLYLKHEFSLNPHGVSQLTVVEYELRSGMLTLTAKMSPRLEDLSEGEQVTVLRKIR